MKERTNEKIRMPMFSVTIILGGFIFLCKFAVMISKNSIKYVRSLALKKVRREENAFVAEGGKLFADLIGYFVPRNIFATKEWMESNHVLICKIKELYGVVVDEAADEELRKMSFQETPQDILAVFLQSENKAEIEHIARENLCIALDEVQNPGNLGTIMRVADWFGIEHVFCTSTCADVYNPKTVQATMGALARVKVHYCNLEEALRKIPADIPVYGTFLDGENIYTQELSSNGVILMGNEGRGISQDMAKYVTKRVLIPSYPPYRPTSESLNVAIATSIVCAEFRRRLQ